MYPLFKVKDMKKKIHKLDPKMVGARTYIREVNTTITVNEEAIPVLLRYGKTEFFVDQVAVPKKTTKVDNVDTSREQDKHRKALDKITFSELREEYPNVKAKTKKELNNKVVTGKL